MEKKLKTQKRKLIFRVSIILFAVWLAVSAVYGIIRFNSEKQKIKNNVNIELQLNTVRNINAISGTGIPADCLTYYLIESTKNLFEDNEIKRNLNTELAVCEYPNGKTLADTAHKLDVVFGIKTGVENSSVDYGFIDREVLLSGITQAQLNEIADYLNTERSDEKYYELLCTKFYMDLGGEIIPKELQIVLTEEENVWYAQDEPVKTFALKIQHTPKDNIVFPFDLLICSDMHRNVIPKEFLFNVHYADDIIGVFGKDELEKTEAEKHTGFGEYTFCSTDLLNYNPNAVEDKLNDTNSKTYLLRCAKRVNVLDSCKNDLITGILSAFLFFLIIAVLLIFLTWRIIKNQSNEEQKRIELTNALAHDIKTPLFVISGYAQNLKENINNEKKEHFANRIIFKIEEANALLHKMLNLGKLESYKIQLHQTDFNLYDLTKEILADYVSLPGGKSFSVSVIGNNTVTADRELIKTALENLIDNAVNYASDNSVIEIKIEGTVFSISNQCDNLTKSDLKEITKPYVKKDKSRHQNGNGLGLAIVKAILDLHGVKYDMEMKENIVSFSFKL